MPIPYKKQLKTGFPNGERVTVFITQAKDHVLIDTDRKFDFLKSAPDIDKRTILGKVTFNFRAGQFRIKCTIDDYPKVIIAFTKYLEDLVFAAMIEVEKKEKKNDNSNSGKHGKNNSGRNKKRDTSGNNDRNKKKGFGTAISSLLPVQEGTSKPKTLGKSDIKPIAWPRRVIESAKNALKKGLKFYNGHNPDNSTDDRHSLAEYVGRLAKEVGGRLHEIVIGYFPDKEAAENYDVCSIEADIETTDIPGSMTIAEKIESITGIALGNSEDDVPAFADAKKLLSVQCFEGGEPSKNKTGLDKPKGGEPIMTYKEAIEAIKDFNIMPHQAFTEQDLRNDRVLGTVYTERDTFKTENEALKTEKEANDKKLVDQDKKILQADAKTRMEKIIPEGSTDKQKKYISDNFKPEVLENLSDEGLKVFVDNQLKVYNENAAFFGADGETPPAGGTPPGNGEGGTPPIESGEKSNEDLAFDDAMENEKK